MFTSTAAPVNVVSEAAFKATLILPLMELRSAASAVVPVTATEVPRVSAAVVLAARLAAVSLMFNVAPVTVNLLGPSVSIAAPVAEAVVPVPSVIVVASARLVASNTAPLAVVMLIVPLLVIPPRVWVV